MNNELKLVLNEIEEVAKNLGKHPSELKQSEVLASGSITEWMLRKNGGLKSIVNAHFPQEDKNLSSIEELSQAKSYINKLEKTLAKKEHTFEQMQKYMSTIIAPVSVPKAHKFSGPKQLKRHVVVALNDTHFGAIVDPNEVGGVNKFDWEVACRRTAFLAKQTAEFKIEKRHEHEVLHVVLNGDILQGVIHDLTARTQQLLSYQQTGALHILVYFIGYVKQYYKKVIVHGISGNHDDNLHRREGGRVTSHKYDSILTPVLAGLSAAFRNEKDITFNFPKGLYLDLQLPGGRCLATHGDTLFSKQLGNPSTNLNVKGLSDVINRFNTGEIRMGRDLVKLVLFGHVHNHVNFTTYDGVKVYVAPSLSGIDSYAHSLAINVNQVGQVIFESTENHIIGDPRLVDLLEADNDSSLDEIIPTYMNDLVIK